jgi:integrase
MQTKPKKRPQGGIYRMPGSKFWWFRWTVYGKRHARSLKTEDEAEATVKAQAILGEGLIAADSYTPKEPTPRDREIHGLIDRYLEESKKRNKKPLRSVTADTRHYILRKFVSECGIGRVGDISLGKISGWLQNLKSEGKSADTLWTYGQRVRSFIKFLVPKYLPPSILTNFTVPEASTNGRRNWVERDEITRSLEAANEDMGLKFVLLCGFDAGLRRNEVSEAKVSWFDLNRGLLHVTQHENFVPKDRDNRTIPLTERFITFLREYLAGRGRNEYVLAPEKTARGANKYRYDTAKRVRAHLERCGIKSTFHDMRRSFGSNRASAGVSIYKIATWLGDGIEVVQRSYGHLVPQDNEINQGV